MNLFIKQRVTDVGKTNKQTKKTYGYQGESGGGEEDKL